MQSFVTAVWGVLCTMFTVSGYTFSLAHVMFFGIISSILGFAIGRIFR